MWKNNFNIFFIDLLKGKYYNVGGIEGSLISPFLHLSDYPKITFIKMSIQPASDTILMTSFSSFSTNLMSSSIFLPFTFSPPFYVYIIARYFVLVNAFSENN